MPTGTLPRFNVVGMVGMVGMAGLVGLAGLVDVTGQLAGPLVHWSAALRDGHR